MWNPFRRKTPPEPTVDLVANAEPLVVGDPVDRIAYARYRLDAIERHILHHGSAISYERMGEFRSETFSLLHTLRIAKAISTDEEDAALSLVGVKGKV